LRQARRLVREIFPTRGEGVLAPAGDDQPPFAHIDKAGAASYLLLERLSLRGGGGLRPVRLARASTDRPCLG
jgi:hypothetical protein